ncbi:hypothetical protein PUATCC27989T_02683 [Phytobacter ursingii]|nr:hypothetical protein PUATCC27989T_02683 [Phytobacter ursingii]
MSASKECALCGNHLSGKNRTKEHIIPNAIGGRKKTTEFICNSCNNKLGEKWDSELSKQLNWFSLNLGINRERGEPPKQLVETIDGERYWLLSDGSFTIEKSSYNEYKVGETTRISLTAKTIDEARNRLKGISRKYPHINSEEVLSNLEVKTEHLNSAIHVSLSLAGSDAGHSLVKTAFAFASTCGIAHNQCDKAVQYLLDKKPEYIPYRFAYLTDFVQDRPKEKVFHCVSLHGDPKSQLLWSYIEYFGFFRIIVLLSEKYTGNILNEIYSIDPIDGSSAGIKIRPNIDPKEIDLILSGNGINHENHLAAANYALSIIMERSRERTLEKAISEGFEYACKELGIKKGEIIPKEAAVEFSHLMMQKITPYIEYLCR